MKTLELLPPNDTMYQALVNRDPSFEGIFFVGVRTTGIFCQPTCSAKNRPAKTSSFSLRLTRRCWAAIVLVCAANRWIRSLRAGVDQAAAGRG